ncbi:MAG: hypothetical protein M1814_004578 [Vezdaea aestivalis]|nr:MAG: hypothetical protein M1814_004578 [Vezdaea aestivalis]
MRSSRFCFVATVNPLSLLCFLHIARLTAQAWNLPPVPRPPFTENFDPARADPIGRLTCEGPLPPWRLPKVGDWDPNEATLLEVCAKPQYGGHYSPDLQDQFRGNAGFCYQSTFGREGLTFASITDFVAFDNNHTHYPGGYGTLVNPRLQSYCMLRCRCTSDTGTLRNRLDQDTELFTGVGIRLDEYTDGYQVDLDRFDDFANPQRHFIRWENGKRKMHIISSGQQTTLMEDEWEQGNPGQPKYYKGSLNVKRVSVLELSYNPINRPICDDGPQPDFPLAAPLDREYQRRFYLGYNRPQTICAAALLGGNRVYNAGAYCHREDAENWDNLPDSRKLASLWFSWEVTPSLAWTMEYNPRFAIQIQKGRNGLGIGHVSSNGLWNKTAHAHTILVGGPQKQILWPERMCEKRISRV